MDEGAKGHTGWALGKPGLGVVVPSSACDIEVNPGCISGKFLQEHCARDCTAALTAADVLDVCETSP